MFEKDYLLSDRYLIKRSVGEGGMANVYLAFDNILQRNVAIKVLRGDLSDDELFIKRFKREALAATALNHPNIVQIFDIGEENNKYFIVMEYVEGVTLKQLILKRKRLTISEVKDIIMQVTLGINHAHNKQIIHRDIKPHNILIQKDGTVKITDFGIAVTLNATLLTQTNSILGSVHYLPPEQISGDVSNVRSDIYSIGILMYELLTGELPYNGDSAVTIALMHVRDEFPSPRKIDASISQSIENIIIRATAKNPKNRYNSAQEMHDDLRKSDKNANVEKLILDDKMEEEVMHSLLNKSDTVEIKKNNEKNKKKTLFILIAVIVFIASLVFILFSIMNKEETIIVPDVVGLSREEATKELIDAGFTISTDVKFDSSSKYKVDKVIALNVKKGTKKPLGFSIIITVSTGPSKYMMEDFTSQDVFLVKNKLEEMGFVVSIQEKESEKKIDENKIIEQSPISGTEVEAGSIITLYVAKEIVYYPNFISEKYTKDSVQVFCTANSISCTFQYAYSNIVASENLISQSIAAGSKVNKSDALTIIISNGNEPSSN
ncbi:MAG: Stk1 family PASTA domain-containing Ser/Thr kinase [Bacilli bacterium]